MGILHPVYIRVTGGVQLFHPWVRTLNVVTAPNAVSALTGYADIPVQVDLKNTSGIFISGTVMCDIDGTVQLPDQIVSVNSMDSTKADFWNVSYVKPVAVVAQRVWRPASVYITYVVHAYRQQSTIGYTHA